MNAAYLLGRIASIERTVVDLAAVAIVDLRVPTARKVGADWIDVHESRRLVARLGIPGGAELRSAAAGDSLSVEAHIRPCGGLEAVRVLSLRRMS